MNAACKIVGWIDGVEKGEYIARRAVRPSGARLTDGEQGRSITTFQSRVGVAGAQGENWFFVLNNSPENIIEKMHSIFFCGRKEHSALLGWKENPLTMHVELKKRKGDLAIAGILRTAHIEIQ